MLVLLSNREDVIILELLKSLKLFIEVTLELEDDLFKEFNLTALSLVTIKIVRLIENLENVVALKSSLDVVDAALGLNDFPVNLLHAFDVTVLTLLCQGCKSCLLIGVSLASLGAQLTLRDCKDRL